MDNNTILDFLAFFVLFFNPQNVSFAFQNIILLVTDVEDDWEQNIFSVLYLFLYLYNNFVIYLQPTEWIFTIGVKELLVVSDN